MPTCPNGHQSGSDDWCEVCGHRMTGASAPHGAVPPPPGAGYGYPQQGQQGGYGYPQEGGYGAPQPAAPPQLCPQCQTPREANEPYCEECRWNFLTNTATSYTPAAPRQPVPGINLPPGFQAQQPQHGGEYTSSRPSQMNRPAEPLHPDHSGPMGGPGQGSPFGGPGSGPNGPHGPQGPHGQGAPPNGPMGGPPPPPPAQGYQQPGPPPPGPGAPMGTQGDDDWMLPPPSQQTAPPVQHPLAGGGYPAPQQQAPAGWMAVIGPDRDYFMAMMHRSGPEAASLNLPAYSPEQERRLTGNQITIGRRRHSTGEIPDIDLSVPPEDPGVSHQHAVLVQQPDGGWAVVDQNSTNGTTVNGGEEPIQPFVPVPLQDGDRVHVGAWTTITLRRG
ncbi:FHA domain-containing protein [Streptomyces sp. N35]|uniref:FHA domain-containing protein n=1 Tax=Streptomyces sp. N35 TaxID=2795730 RepID=UPI0018F476E3|nr:FHA domain-containing protein [Streptomyces sp. N35]